MVAEHQEEGLVADQRLAGQDRVAQTLHLALARGGEHDAPVRQVVRHDVVAGFLDDELGLVVES